MSFCRCAEAVDVFPNVPVLLAEYHPAVCQHQTTGRPKLQIAVLISLPGDKSLLKKKKKKRKMERE